MATKRKSTKTVRRRKVGKKIVAKKKAATKKVAKRSVAKKKAVNTNRVGRFVSVYSAKRIRETLGISEETLAAAKRAVG